jgi:hypothetical protein
MYIIRDCTGAIVGRKEGYKTSAVAMGLLSRRGSIRKIVNYAFIYRDREKYPSLLICSVKLES